MPVLLVILSIQLSDTNSYNRPAFTQRSQSTDLDLSGGRRRALACAPPREDPCLEQSREQSLHSLWGGEACAGAPLAAQERQAEHHGDGRRGGHEQHSQPQVRGVALSSPSGAAMAAVTGALELCCRLAERMQAGREAIADAELMRARTGAAIEHGSGRVRGGLVGRRRVAKVAELVAAARAVGVEGVIEPSIEQGGRQRGEEILERQQADEEALLTCFG